MLLLKVFLNPLNMNLWFIFIIVKILLLNCTSLQKCFLFVLFFHFLVIVWCSPWVNSKSLVKIKLRIRSHVVSHILFYFIIIEFWVLCEHVQECLVHEELRDASDMLNVTFFYRIIKKLTSVGCIIVSFDGMDYNHNR